MPCHRDELPDASSPTYVCRFYLCVESCSHSDRRFEVRHRSVLRCSPCLFSLDVFGGYRFQKVDGFFRGASRLIIPIDDITTVMHVWVAVKFDDKRRYCRMISVWLHIPF